MAHMTEYTCGFLKVDARVLLLRKAKPDWQRGKLNGVGGKCELMACMGRPEHPLSYTEDPMKCMHREWAEETGMEDKLPWNQFATLLFPGVAVHFFRAEIQSRSDLPGHCTQNDVGETFEWCNLQKLLHERHTYGQVIPNLYWLLPMAFGGDDRVGHAMVNMSHEHRGNKP